MTFVGGLLFVLDQIDGEGVHLLEQFWHPGGFVEMLGSRLLRLPGGVFIALSDDSDSLEATNEYGWYSDALGSKVCRPLIRVAKEVSLPYRLATAFMFSPQERPDGLDVESSAEGIRLKCAGQRADFAASKRK
jgi:hypothetical protein